MVSADEDRARAEQHAREALAWIAEHKNTPSPESFEVAFNNVTGRHAALKRNIQNVLNSGGKIDDYILTLLHQRYFSSRKIEAAIAAVGEELSRELASLLEIVTEDAGDGLDFQQALDTALNELSSGRPDRAATESVLDRASQAMQGMIVRSRQLQERLQQSSQQLSALREKLETTRKESLTDPMTGIGNRKAFELAFQQHIDAATESVEPLSVIVYDIDCFGRFNQSWGPEVGDHALRSVATCLMRNINGRDVAARIGDDEFAVILPKTSIDAAAIVANQIRLDIAGQNLVQSSSALDLCRVTLSAGVAQHALSDTIADILHRAHDCLHAAKLGGSNQVVSETDRRLKAVHAA